MMTMYKQHSTVQGWECCSEVECLPSKDYISPYKYINNDREGIWKTLHSWFLLANLAQLAVSFM